MKAARGPITWAKRSLLALVLVGAAVIPGRATSQQSQHCTGPRCTSAGSILWTVGLPGAWLAEPGVSGTLTSRDGAYTATGGGVVVIGSGTAVTAFRATSGKRLWRVALTDVPAGSAIVGVRAFSGVVAVGVEPNAGPSGARKEVILSAATGSEMRIYPAAAYGGTVLADKARVVIVGTDAVTAYATATGRVIWSRATGAADQTWRVSGQMIYVADSGSGSPSVAALRRINLSTGAEQIVRLPDGGAPGTLSDVVNGVALFSSSDGVAAYGAKGNFLWSRRSVDVELADSRQDTVYLASGNQLLGVNVFSHQVVSSAAISVASSLYWVTNGVALGLDEDGLGEAWGYNLRTRRVVWTSGPLPWPHFFVDLSGLGGSASGSSDIVLLATCAQVGTAPAPHSAPSCLRPQLSAVRI